MSAHSTIQLPQRLLRRVGHAVWWRIRAAIWAVHDLMRNLAWTEGQRVRRWRAPTTAGAVPGRVVHVTGSFDIGGTQTQIKYLCTATNTRFQHVAVEIFPELNYLYRQGVTIDSSAYALPGPWGGAWGRMVANRNRRASQLVQIYKLACDFRRERPQVVVGWGHEMCVTTFLAATIARVPHIVFCIRTVNPTFGWVDPPLPALLLRAHRAMLPWVSKVVVNSTLLQGDHSAWVGMNADAIAVCANGIEVAPATEATRRAARAAWRSRYGIADDVVVITNVGRFSREKGQLTLIEANRLLLNRNPDTRFVWLLLGDGPVLPVAKELVEKHQMANVIFAGRSQDVAGALAASDIFVMPSDFEGMPNAMMEAMAHGLPCVSTNRSGALDVARDGIEALYFEPRDGLQLARHLVRLFDEPAFAQGLGKAALARLDHFTVTKFVDNFEAILSSLGQRPL